MVRRVGSGCHGLKPLAFHLNACANAFMLIELIVVGAVLMYLYSAGILDFNSPHAVFISVVITLGAGAIGFFFTHFIARRIVDSMFGISSWSGGGTRKPPKMQALKARVLEKDDVGALERLVLQMPSDVEISRRLADHYLRDGEKPKFIEEKNRILRLAKLTTEETCTIYNRLTDVEVSLGHPQAALGYLEKLVDQFPDSTEATNARKRMEVLKEKYPEVPQQRETF